VTTVVTSQFTGPTPYWLQKHPMTWAEFLYAVHDGKYNSFGPAIVYTDEDGPTPSQAIFRPLAQYKLDIGHSAYREGPDGRLVIYQTKWDTSG
jgi:formylglycine-generating enzyme required for sulfatase activity